MTLAQPAILGEGIAARISPAEGERVLWIHGYTMDSSIWRELWQSLPGWHHIGIDLPGHGASGPMHSSESLPTLARRIARLMLDQGARHLVGISFGGMVALQVAIEAREAASTLVLGSPALGGGPKEPAAETRNAELARLYRQRGAGPWLADLWMESPPDIFTGARAHPHLWAALRDTISRHSWAELADSGVYGLVRHVQSSADLRRIRARTLVIVGENDMAPFKRTAELIRQAVPGSRRVYLPGAGHLGLLELPEAAAPILAAHWSGSTEQVRGNG